MLIILSGSTCTGKSTIGRLLACQCANAAVDMVFHNETSIHSAALQLMFREPEKHAFIIQCEFLVRRTGVLLQALRHHTHVTIERYIDDDHLFAEYWRSKGVFSQPQYELYQRLWQECHKVLPKPDCTVFFRCDVETATSRLLERERTAGEASEVPESFIQQYVSELTEKYEDYVSKSLIRPNLIVNGDVETADKVIKRILQTIR